MRQAGAGFSFFTALGSSLLVSVLFGVGGLWVRYLASGTTQFRGFIKIFFNIKDR